MKSRLLLLIELLIVQRLPFLCVSLNFDFFYFVQQWPGSYCDTKRSCCYPTTGKPKADFGIHGLWPQYKNNSYPTDCDTESPYNETMISDLICKMRTSWPTLACPINNGSEFWSHEWTKHGTCSESVLDQHEYFQAALKIKDKVNLLQILKDTGIQPDGKFYRLDSIKEAIKEGTGHVPGIECNRDVLGHFQLFQIYLCVDTSGSEIIECPLIPKRKCNTTIEFPSF